MLERKNSKIIKQTELATEALRSAAKNEFGQYIQLSKRAAELIKGFPYFAGPIAAAKSLFRGRVKRLQKYEHWPTLRNMAKPMILAGRVAKAHFIDLELEYGVYLGQAADELHWDGAYAPEGVMLPFVDYCDNPLGRAYYEVEIIVGNLSNLILNDETTYLMNSEPIFRSLVAWAEQNPPPELTNLKFFNRYK